MVQGPGLSRDDRGVHAVNSFGPDLRFERKLSEYMGYTMLAASVALLSYGLYWVFS